MSNSTEPVFVLVHGTFARNAKWPLPDSSLSRSLLGRWPGAVIQDVRWSGANTFSARFKAANLIKSAVREASATQTRPIFLVGHSHGGSAIHYALRDSEVADATSGAIFLSVPFAAIGPRQNNATLAMGLVAILLLALTVAFPIWLGWSIESLSLTTALLFSVFLLVVIPALWWAILRHGDELSAIFSRTLDKAVDELVGLGTVVPVPVPSMYLRSTSDEVGILLSSVQFMSRTAEILTTALIKAQDLLLRPAVRLVRYPLGTAGAGLGYAFALLVLIAAGSIEADFLRSEQYYFGGGGRVPFIGLVPWIESHGPVMSIALTLLWVSVVPLLFLSPLLLLMAAVAWATATLALFSFGRMSLFRAMFCEISVETIPYGTHVLTHLKWMAPDSLESAPWERLRHSEPYLADEGTQAIIDWLDLCMTQQGLPRSTA